MAAPRALTAFAKSAGTTTARKSLSSAAKKSMPKRAASATAKPAASVADPAAQRDAAADMLHELQINGDALSAQIARLADRFL